MTAHLMFSLGAASTMFLALGLCALAIVRSVGEDRRPQPVRVAPSRRR